MKPEVRFLFLSTRQHITGGHYAAMLEITRQHRLCWNSIFMIAEKNGIAPLIYTNITRIPELASHVPEEVLDHYRWYSLRQAYLKARREKLLREAVEYFHQKSIRVLLIKGAALDWLVYDQPWYTVSKDIDIVLDKKKSDLTPDEIRELVVHFHQSGIEFDFFEHHDMNMNGILPVDFSRIWQDAQVKDYRGQEIWIPTPEDMLLAICINSCRKRFMNLKSLCDIAETIQKFKNIDWQKFARRSIDFECNNIVYFALMVTRKTLGCQFPAEVLRDLAVHPVRSQMIQFATTFGVRQLSISPTLPTPVIRFFGRQLDLALILTYSTYSFSQIGRKIKDIQRAGSPNAGK